MRDVVLAAGERFDRRPAQPMPGKVERADRHAPIDDPHVGQLGRDAPPARDPSTSSRTTVISSLPVRASARGDLMDVFADAGAGPEGRTVIDDDPHAAEPITTGPYPCWSMGWKDILAALWRFARRQSRMKIAVVGSGYVGLVLGACLAENGNDVTCIDKDAAKVRSLRRGVMPIYEPGLEEMVRRNRAEKRLEFTTDLPRAVRAASIVFIAVGTPQHEDGSADLSHVLGVARDIAKAMNGYKVIVDKSTVPVGTAARVRELIATRNHASLQRRQQPRIPEAGRGGRGFPEARSRRHWRRRRSRASS